ncbi:winged helix-turn-helix transcriptional regulator [Chitinophaga deserti]|uniref:winged helix-turn-helix transcriptional regulator n=1 Tax=Chitinophaga deserti TaxID=2164099 RepID=UPI000D6B38D4|nr:helix-turn-helix domain-containing protein [Chitinophaga deserti]
MYEKKISENLDCGINVANKILGGKWRACIIDSIARGIRRPSGLQREIPEAPSRVIQMHLRELEALQVIRKETTGSFPLKAEYFLTPLGESALPLIAAMDQWGNANKEYVQEVYAAMIAEDAENS